MMDFGFFSGLIPEGDRRRSLPVPEPGMTELCSNDYLGIGSHDGIYRHFVENFMSVSAGRHVRIGSVSSRLLYVGSTCYDSLEKKLAAAYGSESALLFNSGYHANTGIIPAISSPQMLVVADKLVHASIIDGLRLSSVKWVRYRHNDMKHLERILEGNASDYRCVLVVTESVFSMDGDVADLNALVALKSRFGNMMLYVDEAHAFGVYGKKGLGMCERLGLLDSIDIIVGTFGKAYASAGAFAVLPSAIRDVLVNRSRPLIFSTALSPVNVEWNIMILDAFCGDGDNYVSAEIVKLRERLVENADRLRSVLSDGLRSLPADEPVSLMLHGLECSSTHIVPLMAGSDSAALAMAASLRSSGFDVRAVRPPTVPENTSRIRLSVNASLACMELDGLAAAIIDFMS